MIQEQPFKKLMLRGQDLLILLESIYLRKILVGHYQKMKSLLLFNMQMLIGI